MEYNFDEMREALGKDFKKLDAAWDSHDTLRAMQAIRSIKEKYGQMESNCMALKRQVENLTTELEQVKRVSQTLYSAPAKKTNLDDESLYIDYLSTKSFRKTGIHFNCDGKTVKNRLIRGGYIKA